MQAEGGKDADRRVAAKSNGRSPPSDAYESGPDRNVEWLHGPDSADVAVSMPNPVSCYRCRLASRGKKNVSGILHRLSRLSRRWRTGGPGTQLYASSALNFTTLRRHLARANISAAFYITDNEWHYGHRHAVLQADFGIGTRYGPVSQLCSGYICRLHRRPGIQPRGIEAAYEPLWVNPYLLAQRHQSGGHTMQRLREKLTHRLVYGSLP